MRRWGNNGVYKAQQRRQNASFQNGLHSKVLLNVFPILSMVSKLREGGDLSR